MIVVCFAIVLYFGHITEAVEPKSVNLALETVLQFDRKDKAADLEVLNNVQNFLENIKHVLSDQKGSRRHNEVIKDFKFTDFILEAAKVLRTYRDEDLEEVFTVLDDESRKYHYKGCKFYELVDNQDLRKFMSKKLEEGKSAPAATLRRYLDQVVRTIRKEEFGEKDNEMISLVNSLYTGSENLFDTVLQGLKTFKHRERAEDANSYLKEILSNGLRSVLFNYYTDLNDNARQQLKNTVYNYWNEYNGIDAPENTSPEKNRFKAIDVNTFNHNEMNKWSRSAGYKHQKITPSVSRGFKGPETNYQVPKAKQNLQLNSETSSSFLQSFINNLGLGSDVVDKAYKTFKNKERKIAKNVKSKVKTNKKVTKKDLLTLEHEILLSSIEDNGFSAKMDKLDTNNQLRKEKAIRKPKKVVKSKKKSYKAPSRNKKYMKKPATHKSSFEEMIDSKTNSDSENSELKDILKKYDLSNEDEFKEEIKPVKKLRSHEFENGELGLLIGGQKVRDFHGYRAVKTTRKPLYSSKKKKEKKIIKQPPVISFTKFRAVEQHRQRPESSSLKGLKSHYKTTRKPKHHHSAKRRKTIYEPKIRVTPSNRKSFTAFAATISDEGEGLTIESFEDKNKEIHLSKEERKSHDSRQSHDARKEFDSRQGHDARNEFDSRQAHDAKNDYDSSHAHDSRKDHDSRQAHDFRKDHDSRHSHDYTKTHDSITTHDSRKPHDAREKHESRQANDANKGHDSRQADDARNDYDYKEAHDSKKSQVSRKDHDSGKTQYSRKVHDSSKTHDSRKIHYSRKDHNSKKTHNSRKDHSGRKINDLSDYYYDSGNETIYYPNNSINVVNLIQKLEKQLNSVKNQMNIDNRDENVSEKTVPFTTKTTTSVSLTKRASITELELTRQDEATTTETSRTTEETTKIDTTKQTRDDMHSAITDPTITETTTTISPSTFSELTFKNKNISTIPDIIKNNTVTEPKILFNQSVVKEIDGMFSEMMKAKPIALNYDAQKMNAEAKMSINDVENDKQINTKEQTTITVLSLPKEADKTLTTDKLDVNSLKTTNLSSTKSPNSNVNETTISGNDQDLMQLLEDGKIDSYEKQLGTVSGVGYRRKKDLSQIKDNASPTKMGPSLVEEIKSDNFDDPFNDLDAMD